MPPRQKDRATQKSLAFGTTSNPVRHCETLACDVPRGITVNRQTRHLNLVHARQRATLERRRVQCGASCDALCSEVWFERRPHVVHGICLAPCTFANARGGQQCWQSRHFPARRLLAFMLVVVVAWWSRKQWWRQRPYPRLRCLVILAAPTLRRTGPVVGPGCGNFSAKRWWPLRR